MADKAAKVTRGTLRLSVPKDKSAKAYLGYRYLDLEYIKDVVSLEITVKGPIVGVGFLF